MVDTTELERLEDTALVQEWSDEQLASRLDQLAMQVTEIWEDPGKHAVLHQAARRLRRRATTPSD